MRPRTSCKAPGPQSPPRSSSRIFPWRRTPPTYSHIVYVEYENKEYNQIIGSTNCPYITQLSQQAALFTNFYAQTHPSQPNYLYAFSGSNQGVDGTDSSCSDGGGSSNGTAPFTTPNFFAQLLNQGYSFGAYNETMPSVGYTGDGYPSANDEYYMEKHNPVVNWQHLPAAARPPQPGPLHGQHAVHELPHLQQRQQRHLQRLLVAADVSPT